MGDFIWVGLFQIEETYTTPLQEKHSLDLFGTKKLETVKKEVKVKKYDIISFI
jgi:hypothetical protein